MRNIAASKTVAPVSFFIIPSEPACQAVALCEDLEESLKLLPTLAANRRIERSFSTSQRRDFLLFSAL